MPRTIHLAVFPNDSRAAHSAVFIPTGDKGKVGKLIHVTKTTGTGFFVEFKRNYDFSVTKRKHHIITLAQVDDQHISDTVGNGQPSADTTAHDQLESVATRVVPSDHNPDPFDPLAPNCQNWLEGYVQELVEQGFATSSACSVIQSALEQYCEAVVCRDTS